MKRFISTKVKNAKRLQFLLTMRHKYGPNAAPSTELDVMQEFKVDAFHEKPPKPTELQHDEINGRLPFDEGHYHCMEYNDLLKSIVPIRHKYAESVDLQTRKDLATEEITHWHNYMKVREKTLPDHYEINNSTLGFLEESFQRESERHNIGLASHRVIDYHYKFTQLKKFDIPIHQRNMIQMLHPYHGYMTAIDGKFFSFDEIVKMYRQQLVSSYERTLGQHFLAGKFLYKISLIVDTYLAFICETT